MNFHCPIIVFYVLSPILAKILAKNSLKVPIFNVSVSFVQYQEQKNPSNTLDGRLFT